MHTFWRRWLAGQRYRCWEGVPGLIPVERRSWGVVTFVVACVTAKLRLPFDCLIIQNLQAVQSMGRSMALRDKISGVPLDKAWSQCQCVRKASQQHVSTNVTCGECMITLSLPRSGACNLAILNCAPVLVPRLLRCACGLVMQYCKVFF